MKTLSGDKWRTALQNWGIPSEILNSAPTNPWIHPLELFQVPEEIEVTLTSSIALEVNPNSVLDIGCGGGIGAFALTPPANEVFGVDHQEEMLDDFSRNAAKRGVKSSIYSGFWPEISDQVPEADVVISLHVLFNVSNIEDFLLALNEHAKKRVIIEIPQHHPQFEANYLWKHFWNLDRPENPEALDIIEILKELGINAQIKTWEGNPRTEISIEKNVEFTRIRLCLNANKDEEIKKLLLESPRKKRSLATIWWDK